MIPDAIEVRLKPKERAVSESQLRAATTEQRHVEGWFSILQGQSLTGASFTSVEQLKKHIDAFIESYNEDAEPFVWTKSKVHQRCVKGRRLSDL